MKSQNVTIQMKATEEYFLVMLFILMYKVQLWMKEILKCDHHSSANGSYCAVLFFSTVIVYDTRWF